MRFAVLLALVCGCDGAGYGLASGPLGGTVWTEHVVVGGSLAASPQLSGADGTETYDFDNNGELDWVSPWEQSGRISVILNPFSSPSVTTFPPTSTGTSFLSGIEDATVGDINGDGNQDIIAASEAGQKVVVFFGPSPWSTRITLPTPAPGQRYTGARMAELDGNSNTVEIATASRTVMPKHGYIGYFSSSTPTVAASWSFTQLTNAGWPRSLDIGDYDNDGDHDVLTVDSQWYCSSSGSSCPTADRVYTLVGARWVEANGTNHAINTATGDHWMGTAMDTDGDGDREVLDGGTLGGTGNYLYISSNSAANWSGTWSRTDVALPTDAGEFQAAHAGDIDCDGDVDIVVTTHANTNGLHGVIWLAGPAFTTWQTVDGPTFAFGALTDKFDDLELHDIDGDGMLDVVTTEQNRDTDANSTVQPGAGMVWYENPFSCPEAPDAGG